MLFLENPKRNRNSKDKQDTFAVDLDSKVYKYIVDNFFDNLNIEYLTIENLNYIVDGLMAHRAAFQNIGEYELVDEMNYCLENIVEYLPNIDVKNKYRYREELYNKPTEKVACNFLLGED